MIEVRCQVREDVYLATDADGGYTIVHGTRRAERLGRLDAADLDLLRRLAAGPQFVDGPLVDRLRDGGWLTQHYGALLTVVPLGPYRAPPRSPVSVPRLSRFAVLRRDGDALVLEAPGSPARIVVHHKIVATLLHELATDAAIDSDDPVTTELVALLTRYGFVGDGATAEDDQWSPHERWFHARSRAGHHDLPIGATHWADGRYPPVPARREPWPGSTIKLPTATDLPSPLGRTLDGRRSIRRGDDSHPLTLAQLGDFLHWSAGVRTIHGELTWRPSPAGGALHSLEIYLVVVHMADLEPGMYHYDPFGHLLEPVPAPTAARRQLTGAATAASEHETAPQVVLILAARFGRVMRKYQNMAYALILKEVGALTQTMYLVATAMNLAPCAIGAGDADLFATATGLDPRTESSVGEFVLSSGNPPPSGAA